MDKLCVISMSGGLDSSTLAFKAIEDGFTILPININYGQKNIVEQKSFQNILGFFQRNFSEQILDPVNIDLTTVMETSLHTWQTLRDTGVMSQETDMEFYTPSRNLLFSTIAAVIGEIAALATGMKELKIGLGIHKHTQYDRDYWDITPEFVNRLNHLLSLNDCMSIEMYAPYSDMTKDEIVKDAVRLQVPYKKTWTCYNPTEASNTLSKVFKPCLKCEACLERQNAGDKAEVPEINNYQIAIK
jgi:7-cyano-7-deazaguanine synthase